MPSRLHIYWHEASQEDACHYPYHLRYVQQTVQYDAKNMYFMKQYVLHGAIVATDWDFCNYSDVKGIEKTLSFRS